METRIEKSQWQNENSKAQIAQRQAEEEEEKEKQNTEGKKGLIRRKKNIKFLFPRWSGHALRRFCI